MRDLFQFFSNLPEFLESGGYWLLSSIIILEGLPFVGSIFPGHVAIISAGFLAKLGILDIVFVLVIAIISAALGDVIGFHLGRTFGYPSLIKYGPYFFIKQEHIDRAMGIIDQHVGKTIVLAKFSPLTRSLMPFLVGASGVRIRTFWFFNLVGGALWVTSSVLIGFVFGASYGLVAGYFGKFVFAAVLGTILIVWAYHVINSRFHVFRKYELIMLGLNLIALWALLKTIQDGFSTNSFMANFDISVNLLAAEYVTPFMKNCAIWMRMVGSAGVFHVLGLLVGLGFLSRGKWRRAGIMLLAVTVTSIITSFGIDLFLRARPQNAVLLLSDPSFPSMPAAIVAAVVMSSMYVFVPMSRSWIMREVFIVLGVSVIILLGICEIVLSLNWASDIIAGWALGIFVASGSVLFVRYVAVALLRGTK